MCKAGNMWHVLLLRYLFFYFWSNLAKAELVRGTSSWLTWYLACCMGDLGHLFLFFIIIFFRWYFNNYSRFSFFFKSHCFCLQFNSGCALQRGLKGTWYNLPAAVWDADVNTSRAVQSYLSWGLGTIADMGTSSISPQP